MKELPKIVLKHGAYQNLIVYRKSDVIYEGTVLFCKRFLPAWGDRIVDQMTQAARSCKQNIAEGSAASATSKETEIHLTHVSHATLAELLEDYLDYLKSPGEAEWSMESQAKNMARQFARAYADWETWQPLLLACPAPYFCNMMIVVIQQTKYLIDRMLVHQEQEFLKCGGVRERMHAARTAVRGEKWDDTLYSFWDMADSPQNLQ